jgi:peptidoglycan/LPS O-acetylase OafA/YrhL
LPASTFLSHFSRRTSSGHFIPEIDGLRFIAIAWVYIFHLCAYTEQKIPGIAPTPDILKPVLHYGFFGVPVFFVISGFVLALPFASYRLKNTQRPRVANYFLRRLTRLEPPYLIIMTLLFPLAMIFTHRSFSAILPHYLASWVYAHWLVFPMDVVNALTVVQWSLEIEVQFYLVAPLVSLALFSIRQTWLRRLTLVGALLLAVGAQASGLIASIEPKLTLTLLGYLQYFLVGFLLVDIFLLDWGQQSSRRAAWDILFAVAWICLLAVLPRMHTWLGQVATPFILLAIFCAVFRGNLVNRFFRNPWVATIGGMCYTIYLLHYTLISGVGRLSTRLHWGSSFSLNLMLQLLLVTPMVLIVCGAFFVTIERPCMDRHWPERLALYLRTHIRSMHPKLAEASLTQEDTVVSRD